MVKTNRSKRSAASDVVRRQHETLKLIPRLPAKISARELADRLRDIGFKLSKRTVERSLNALAERFELVHDEGTPQGWSRSGSAASQMSGLDLSTALTLKLAYAYVKPQLPTSILGQLKELANAA